MHKISWGIIGCGDVAEVKSGPAFQQCEHSELLSVMRRNADKAKDFAKRHHVSHWTTNADEILQNSNINAVYIATPPSSHLAYTLKAIKAGKHIYLEKPITVTLSEALQIETALKNTSSKLVVAHYRRKLPAFLKVKELLEENTIGNIQWAEIRIIQPNKNKLVAQTDENWRLSPEISGGGYFYDLAPHQLDLMLNYFGKPQQIQGFAANQSGFSNANDIVNGIMEFPGNVQFNGIWAFNSSSPKRIDRCKIYGEKGIIQFSFFGDEVKLTKPEGKEIFNFKSIPHVQQPMIQTAINYFLGKEENPCSLENGIEVMKIMETFTR
ncbi:Gfo/Idh/MocA family protein [Zunongwangia pacifica]|uniref:Gfo/Idh/MocA family oxidoreductase n=1 Tax=Zunongwangia pacifica TaxID=2911062 RepID=A0A9X2CMH3_9FLAO|nr:Gfo/Idh/MocA family oxidoreductase [Zunongwangia pacifica]MCL6217514.1 Gfo/Idh/MocA family oxidoreductase [Zunongwangia pacifica]